MGNENKPPDRQEREWMEAGYLIPLTHVDERATKGTFFMTKAQRRQMLQRPGPFKPHSTRETYKPYPRLACCQPNYPKKPLAQPWGVPISPAKKLGHPSCPPAANLDKLNVMTQAKAVLSKYYDNYLCADLSEDI